MSVDHKAMIVRGFELADGWEAIVDAHYVMEHEENFIEADAYEGEKVLFGIELDSIDACGYTEYSTFTDINDETMLSNFAKTYPGAIVDCLPAMYLVCKIH